MLWVETFKLELRTHLLIVSKTLDKIEIFNVKSKKKFKINFKKN